MTNASRDRHAADALETRLREPSGAWIHDRHLEGTMTTVGRRLADVLSADAKGDSRLMGEDEIGTVQTITGHREAIRDIVHRFNGRVVDSPGDNVLAEFVSVVDAVACAVDIQRVLAERNARLPDDRRLDFRIGVNVEDIVVDGRASMASRFVSQRSALPPIP